MRGEILQLLIPWLEQRIDSNPAASVLLALVGSDLFQVLTQLDYSSKIQEVIPIEDFVPWKVRALVKDRLIKLQQVLR